MKANYTKPLLVAEVFSATQSTARDCVETFLTDQLNLNDPGNCYWDLGRNNKVFVLGQNCNIDGENMDVGCYNNPGEGNYVFRS